MTCRTSTYPEEAVQIANAAGARFLVPVHHQTFHLSFEPFHEPIERFEAALRKTPERFATGNRRDIRAALQRLCEAPLDAMFCALPADVAQPVEQRFRKPMTSRGTD